MLSMLLYDLRAHWAPLHVFKYITFRTLLAGLVALCLSLLLGPPMIRRLVALQIGQSIRDDGPAAHQSKRGTPTMGGVLIVISIVLPTRDRRELLARAIDSVSRQIYQDWELLLVDDGIGQAKLRDLRADHAAGFGIVVEHHAMIAERRQIARDSERGGPATNQSDALAVLLLRRPG